MKNSLIIGIVAAVVFGAAGFFGGIQYAKSQNSRSPGQFQGGRFNGNGTGRGGRDGNGSGGNFRPVVGEIVNQDDKSMTVKIQDGSTKIVILSATTTYSQMQTADKSDLKVGSRVGVFGTTNPDGSVTAQNIQLNPLFRGPTGTTGGSPR